MMTRFATLVAQKEIRDGKRYKQKEIARATGVAESTVSRWMRGEDIEDGSMKTVRKLCDWLECDAGDLVYLDREPA